MTDTETTQARTHVRGVPPRGRRPVKVTGYLVTTPDGAHMTLWMSTASYTNWLDARPNRHDPTRTTWHVMVADEDAHFLAAATALPDTTVEEIDGAGDHGTYILRAGTPGTGWGEPGG